MTVHECAPLGYRHWSGECRTVGAEGDWPNPVVTEQTSRNWVHLGWCPSPTTTRERFVYHLCHGLLMRYPFTSVLAFAWRNRKEWHSPTETPEGKVVPA